MRPSIRLYLGIFLLSLAVLAYETFLVRLFAIIQWYHFASLVVSMSLLGFAASSTFINSFRRIDWLPTDLILLFSSICFSISVVFGPLWANQIILHPLRHSFTIGQGFLLLLHYLLIGLPFFFAGLVLCVIFSRRTTEVGRLYGFNLLGSGLGCLLPLILLPWFKESTLLVIALFGLGAALCFCYRTRLRGLLILGVIISLAGFSWFPQFKLSPYKTLSYLLNYQGSRLIESSWSATSRLDLVQSSLVRYAPGLSTTYQEPIPEQLGLVVDGDKIDVVLKPSLAGFTFLNALSSSAVYEVKRGGQALVINSGGGLSIANALAHGFAVIALEPDPHILKVIRAQGHNLYQESPPHQSSPQRGEGRMRGKDNRVKTISGDVRSYLKTILQRAPKTSFLPLLQQGSTPAGSAPAKAGESREAWIPTSVGMTREKSKRFEVIEIALRESVFAASTGLSSLSENYLFTLEAFDDYFDCLGAEGILTITRWLDAPPRDSIRLFSTIYQVLKNRGLRHPENHLVMFRSINTYTILLKKQAFTSGELSALQEFLNRNRFDIIWKPGVISEEVNRYNIFPEPTHYLTIKSFLEATTPHPTSPTRGEEKLEATTPHPTSPTRGEEKGEGERTKVREFFADYPFNITPTTDDKPFFSYFFDWGKSSILKKKTGFRWEPFFEGGFVLGLGLVQAIIFSLVFILLPLLLRKRIRDCFPRRNVGVAMTSPFIYFSALGLGFMFITIPLIQYFILILGYPVYAFAYVSFITLCAAGLGSLIRTNPKYTIFLIFLLVILTAVYGLSLKFLGGILMTQSLGWKLVIGSLIILPLGCLMGIPFPAGIRWISQYPGIVPWAWCFNGCASVVGSILATLVALSLGFSGVLLLGAACYLLALLSVTIS